MSESVCKHCGYELHFCGNLQNRDNCRYFKVVKDHLWRARNALSRAEQRYVPEPHTLTVKEWIATLCDFEWRCAYCGKEGRLEMEHFIPIGFGVGTVKENCVPACHHCNTIKSDYHPIEAIDTLTKQRNKIPDEAIERVRNYLLSVSKKS